MRMKSSIALFAGVFLLLSLAVIASAEDQKKTSTKEDRLTGTVHMVDKDTSSIIIRKGAVQRKVVYNAETKFTIQNKPGGSIDDVIVGRRAICLGTFNDKTHLVATRVDVRTK
jgi:ABC-type oligopeptide transport system substrate-binding subunit